MTSVLEGGRGSPKSRGKEQNQLICDSDKGERVKKSENFADVIYGSPPMAKCRIVSVQVRRVRRERVNGNATRHHITHATTNGKPQ